MSADIERRYADMVAMVAKLPSELEAEFKAFMYEAAEEAGADMTLVRAIIDDIDRQHG